MGKTATVWKLKKGMDRRFRSGHPWVYSNELLESPKGIAPGETIRLQDPAGNPLALGYGNPKSLIAFRVLARGPEAEKIVEQYGDPFSAGFLAERLKGALSLRLLSGLGAASFRLCFGEADYLPGLVIDRYLMEGAQAFVVQAHTAGADRMLGNVIEALHEVCKAIPGAPAWEKTAIVFRNDLGVRALEGLSSESAPQERIQRPVSALDLKNALIEVRPSSGAGAPLRFRADLIEGQKTGFFLDQAYNVSLATRNFASLAEESSKEIRVLDLCCYVGQWATQLARAFKAKGAGRIAVTAVDASQSALDFARENIEREGAKVTMIKGDVLKDLARLEDRSFDLVISDPPALIKSRKDIPTGKHAYLQLNTQVFRLVRAGGGVVSCSCSGLLEEEEFLQALSKAAYRNQARVRWVARGSQAPDHPMLAEFPEGRYLKSWQGWV